MNIKKTVALLVSVVLIFSICSVNVSATEKGDLIYGTGIAKLYSSNSTTDTSDTLALYGEGDVIDYQSLYNTFADGVKGMASEIDISRYGVTVENVKNVVNVLFNMLWNQAPDVFYLSNAYGYGCYSDGTIALLKPMYNCTAEQYEIMHQELEETANGMIKDIRNSRLSDMQKALIIHDRIAVKCEYDESAYNGTATYKAYTAYGALVDGLAVCDGYTKAYSYLLSLVGINSKRCTSDEMNHAWNIVYINGNAYHVDVTWDDPVFENPADKPIGFVMHTNFMLSTYALHNNFEDGNDVGCHKSEDFDHEPADTTYDRYFWRDCTHETILIGDGLYHYDDNGILYEYDNPVSLVESGIGDINEDNRIDSLDITRCRQFVMGKLTPNDSEYTACDMTKDGNLSLSDLVRMKKILLYIK